MEDTKYKPRRVPVNDELFEELRAKDDDIRDSKKNAIAGSKQEKEVTEDDYLAQLMKEFNMQNL